MIEEMDWVWVKWVWEVVLEKEISEKEWELIWILPRPLLLPLYHNTRSLALRLVTVLPMLLQAVVSIHPLYLPVGG